MHDYITEIIHAVGADLSCAIAYSRGKAAYIITSSKILYATGFYMPLDFKH